MGGMGDNLSHDEVAAALRAVAALFGHWRLTDDQSAVLLGLPDGSTYSDVKRGASTSISPETGQRAAALLGIHKALRSIFREPSRGYAWVRQPNQAFGGQSALERMLSGDPSDIEAVRRYLEAELAGS